MPPAVIAAGIGAAGAVGGGLIASSAAKKAARAQEQASQNAAAVQREMFEKQTALQEPFRQAGLTAQQQIMQLLGIGGDQAAPGYGSLAKSFGTDQFQQDPGYAFRQSEGMKALERSAAARGGLLSGGTLKGIQRFGQDLASQEYQNAFNRYQVERAARLNPLQSLMGSGQSAANTLTSAAGNLGQGIAGTEMAGGQARASGYVGSANALAGALGSIGQTAMQYPLYQAQTNYLNSLSSGGGGGYGGGYGAPASSAAPTNYMYGGLNPRFG
jgi:hypothetical protein